MTRISVLGGLLSVALLAPITSAQGDKTSAKPFGTIFKSEVDGTIRAIRARTGGDLGQGSVRRAAQVLCAMGNCHRLYTAGDGPVVRPAIRLMFSGVQQDGSFADASDKNAADRAVTTDWVLHAIESIGLTKMEDRVSAAQQFLAARNTRGAGPWRARVDAFAAALRRGEGSPKDLGKKFADTASSYFRSMAGTGPSLDVAVDALCNLVALQVVAREHDLALKAAKAWSKGQQRGLDYLLAQQEGGTFFVETPGGKFPDLGLSSLALAALQTKPVAQRSDAETQVIQQGLEKLIAAQNEDGSYGTRSINYTTCAAILALAKSGREDLRPAMVKARNFVLALQNTEVRGYASSDRDYGSIGYGGDERGDLSNLQFAIEALRASGLEAGDEAFAKAIVFLQRTQNLRTVNDFEGRVRDSDGNWIEVTSGDDGGAAYYPGNSPAGYVEMADGRRIPRSYGSMTYAMLKTYTLAGIPAEDERVQAIVKWLGANFSVTENPGADPRKPSKTRYQGLFYYYMVMSQALDSAGIDKVGEIDWRAQLVTQIEKVQRDDGSWLNERNGRWWESRPLVCTIYSLLALERAGK